MWPADGDGYETHLSVGVHVVVRLRRIDLGEQEACLGSTVLRVDVAGHGEACLEDFLGIVHRCLKKLLEVFVLGHVLVFEGSPLGDRLAVIDQDLEERVHQQDAIRLDRSRIEEDRLWWAIERVAVEDRLDHDQRLGEVLAHQHVSVECGLVGRVVEDLQELRAAQVVHELREKTEVLRQPEAVGIVL